MREKTRNDANIEVLRILCAIMVVMYHYVGQGINLFSLPFGKSILYSSFFFAGGRIAVNIFVMIGAWYLCELPFKCKRIVEMWLTTFIYSVLSGIYFYYIKGDIVFLFRGFLPITTSYAWFITIYFVLLLISPLLNEILKNRRLDSVIVFVFFLFITGGFVWPNSAFGHLDMYIWFCMLYLFIGVIRKRNIPIQNHKILYLIVFLLGWFLTSILYFGWDKVNFLKKLEDFGYNNSIMFSQLSYPVCVFTALSLFLFFQSIKLPTTRNRIIRFFSSTTIDQYLVLSKSVPDGLCILFAITGVQLYGFTGHEIHMYLLLFLGMLLISIVGRFRIRLVDYLLKGNRINKLFAQIDEKVNG